MENKIDYIVLTWNSEKTVAKTLKSIQKYGKPSEIIVVDRFSKDNTLKIARNFGCFIVQTNEPLGSARFIGAKKAETSLIAYVDSFEILNKETFGKNPKNILIGNYLNCYTGYAVDRNIRYNSASGDIVTQLLIFALETKMIDGALVTKMRQNDPLKPESFIAKTKNEIIEASKSKYCPVSANVASSEILEDDGKLR